MSINKPAIQKQLRMNSEEISYLEARIEQHKYEKAEADRTYDIELEFYYHNNLKRLRSKLKDYVAIQKTLKQLMKGD